MRSLHDLLAERVVLFDGGTGTEIYARGVFINHCYEELNLSRPELVEDVHRSFLVAGADAIETNTFSANHARLEPHGLGDRVAEINREGARVARRAAGGHALVGGAIGPLGIRLEPWGPTSVGEAEAMFREQADGLAEGGVDLIVLETFSDLVEIQAAIRAARATGLPVIAMMTVDEEGRTPEGVPPEWVAQKLEAAGADVVGVNCSVGPAPMLSVVETMAGVVRVPVAAMPNAGLPRAIDGRMHYLTNPVYMARYARRFVQAGARVLGGCCGVTPEHVRAMREVLGQGPRAEVVPRRTVDAPRATPHRPAAREEKSELARRVAAGRFVTMVEVTPPRGWESGPRREDIRRIAAAGVDAVLVPDDPRAQARMSPVALARIVLEEAERAGRPVPEPVLQYSCRDRNLLGMQSDLLGAHALGLRNLVLVTGQAPRPGEAVWSTAVFDVDAVGLTNVVSRLNHGLDVGDNPIGDPTSFFAGVLATVGLADPREDVDRFGWKVDAGAEFAITTPVFDVADLTRYLGLVEPFRIPLLATIWPPKTLREAEYLAEEVPGVLVPAATLERMAAAGSPEREEEAGIAIAREMIEGVLPHCEGVLLMGPLARDARALALLEAVRTATPVARAFPGRPGIRNGAEFRRSV